MKNVVFDSFALLSFIFNEAGADVVSDYFKRALRDDKRIHVCVVNWSEVMYRTIRTRGHAAWTTVRANLYDFPLEIVAADLALSETAAEFKAANKMSLADAYAAALTRIKRAELVTGDPEFKALEGDLPKIVWLRK